MWGGTTQVSYDMIGDSLGGTRGIMLDMYRQPYKLIKAIDKILPEAIRMGVSGAKASRNPLVFIPLHKGARGFMSLDHFKAFYWPTLQKLMLGPIEEGAVSMPFFEADYTDRLEIIEDIPWGKATYWFESTDIFKAKKILGNRICIRGNVPASLLITDKPQEARDYCKKLIDVVGKGRGFIMDGVIGIPDEAKVENVKAMLGFTKEYGVYR